MEDIIKAWIIEGPRPDLHRKQIELLHRNWPALYKAIQKAVQNHETNI